jgi:hypothetical protein
MTARRRKARKAVTGAVYPDFTLTGEQWDTIARLAGIPASANKARLELQTALGLYRLRTRLRMLSDDARKELAAIGGGLRNLQERFERLAGLLPSGWSISFSKELRVLRLIEDRYFIRGGTGPAKTGQTTAAYILVAYLDKFAQRFGGKRIQRSDKTNDTSREYIEFVCEIANFGIGPGTIDKAMADCTRRRGQTPEEAVADMLKRKAESKAKREARKNTAAPVD